MSEPDLQKVQQAFRQLIEGLGLNPDDPHLADTPERAARAWYHELFAGVTHNRPHITTFPADGADEMIVVRAIPVRSFCAHHFLPFIGEAVVGYVPGGDKILGLSKIPRIVNHWSRRPQVQERLTTQVADDIWRYVQGGLGPEPEGGVGVVIRARHMCVELRGVEEQSEMVTSALRGVMMVEPETRSEFLALAREEL